MGRARKTKGAGEETPPQSTMQLVDAASLDAKINAVRGAWTEVEIRRLKRKEELKAYNDRIGATQEQLAGMLRNDRVESHELFIDTCRGLQLKIDKLEAERDACALRWKAKLEEAEQTFRDLLFGEQLPLLLGAGTDAGDPSPIVDAPADAPQQVVALTLADDRMLRVGGRVMIHGAGAHRPGIILELEDRGESKKHGALVRYDGDDPTPAHVMAHQCHPLDGLEGEPAKAKRGKRSRKGAAEDSEADAVAGELDVDVPAAALARGKRTPKPLDLGDRVVLAQARDAGVGTIEAMEHMGANGCRARVRWDSEPDELTDYQLEHIARASKQEVEAAAAALSPSEERARAEIEGDEPADVDVTPIATGRRKKPVRKSPPDDVA
jgi:hypothetical protein